MAIDSKSNWDELRRSEDYRYFLKSYLQVRELNLSDLARAAGFARGCVSDILTGRRRLTNKTFYGFEKALRLPQAGKKLFRLLVAQAEPDLFPELKKENLEQEINKLRSQSWSRSRKDVKDNCENWKTLIQNRHNLAVYAASGEPGQGASFLEIQNRTRLPNSVIEMAIQNLIRNNLLKKENGAYTPQDMHLFIEATEQNAVITALFQQACQAAAARSDTALGSNQEFFFTSTFLVRESRLSELKTALRKTILQYVDEAIAPDGDRLVQLVTALHLS